MDERLLGRVIEVYGVMDLYLFFFSSRRRHTRCALVTGVQTCALPIFDRKTIDPSKTTHPVAKRCIGLDALCHGHSPQILDGVLAKMLRIAELRLPRSEELRVGKACVSPCRSRWSLYHYKINFIY